MSTFDSQKIKLLNARGEYDFIHLWSNLGFWNTSNMAAYQTRPHSNSHSTPDSTYAIFISFLMLYHECPDKEYRYISTLSLTSALYGVGGQGQAPAALSPGKRPGTHCKEGWVGPRTSLDG